LPGVREALERLRQKGFLNLVVTNQPDVARGKARKEIIKAMHAKLASELAIDGFYTCWHDDNDSCDCRKPKPGLLLKAAEEHDIDLKSSFLVGDRWKDIEAGIAAKCRTVFLDYGYSEKKPIFQDATTTSLESAAEYIINAGN